MVCVCGWEKFGHHLGSHDHTCTEFRRSQPPTKYGGVCVKTNGDQIKRAANGRRCLANPGKKGNETPHVSANVLKSKGRWVGRKTLERCGEEMREIMKCGKISVPAPTIKCEHQSRTCVGPGTCSLTRASLVSPRKSTPFRCAQLVLFHQL